MQARTRLRHLHWGCALGPYWSVLASHFGVISNAKNGLGSIRTALGGTGAVIGPCGCVVHRMLVSLSLNMGQSGPVMGTEIHMNIMICWTRAWRHSYATWHSLEAGQMLASGC